MSAMLSPGVYLRCSENSTENPWNGLACRPAMNPSTMNFARRSSRATWRITSGFRYFSGVPAKGSVLAGRGFDRPEGAALETGRVRSPGFRTATVVLRRLGVADLGQQPLDQTLGRLTFRLGLEVHADPVPQDGNRDLADVVERHAEPAVHRRHRLTGTDQVLAGA